MDYNANINWIVCGQPKGNRLNILKSFYVKFERKIPALIADFCSYYAPHPNHTVIFYYDATALGSNYAVNDQDLISSKLGCASANHSNKFDDLRSACTNFPLGRGPRV